MKSWIAAGVLALSLAHGAIAADDKNHPPGPPPGEHGGHPPGPPPGMDKDKDGTVTKAEFVAFHEKMFDDMDTNKDGKVTKEEGKAFHETRREKWRERRGERRDDKDKAATTPEKK